MKKQEFSIVKVASKIASVVFLCLTHKTNQDLKIRRSEVNNILMTFIGDYRYCLLQSEKQHEK